MDHDEGLTRPLTDFEFYYLELEDLLHRVEHLEPGQLRDRVLEGVRRTARKLDYCIFDEPDRRLLIPLRPRPRDFDFGALCTAFDVLTRAAHPDPENVRTVVELADFYLMDEPDGVLTGP